MTALKVIRHGRHFTIAIRAEDTTVVVAAFGLPIGWEMTDIDKSIRTALPENWERIVFDLSKTDFADSSLLGLIRRYWQEAAVPGPDGRSRDVCILALPGTKMHEKLKLTRIDRRIRVVESLDAAEIHGGAGEFGQD
ncbi:MAG: hypothetical protein ACMVY4_01490 [Minwuia sp.]|uniref:hypothetical protein n=1 Tax=Minwuia sp. TaxID=2493630 RepID=UPI003A87B818